MTDSDDLAAFAAEVERIERQAATDDIEVTVRGDTRRITLTYGERPEYNTTADVSDQ